MYIGTLRHTAKSVYDPWAAKAGAARSSLLTVVCENVASRDLRLQVAARRSVAALSIRRIERLFLELVLHGVCNNKTKFLTKPCLKYK